MASSTPAQPDALTATLHLAGAAVASDDVERTAAGDATELHGNADELRAVLERYETPLLRYAMTLLATDHRPADVNADAQDVVQEALLRLHRARTTPGAPPIAHLPTWLYRVTHNVALDLLRRRSAQRRMTLRLRREADAQASAAPADDRAAATEQGRLALATLRELHADHASVLALKVFGGLSIRQTATELNLPVSTVTNRLTAALRDLAARLKSRGVTGD